MSGKLTPTFLLLAVALLLWASSLGLSNHLSKQHGVGGTHGAGRGAEQAVKIPDKLQSLREKAEASPHANEARLEYATALREEAYEQSSGALLMEAVQQYSKILEHSPEHPEALFGLASLCLEAGIIDKALEYFPRYLKIRPDDVRAGTDYSLTLLQVNRIDEARTRLQEILSRAPEFVPARLTLALSHKLDGDLEKAKQIATEAKSYVSEDEAKNRIDEFMKALETVNIPEPREESSVAATSGNVSPAELVANYFRQHSIVGPKLRGVTWPERNVAQVALENFPVEQMPAFAKEKFIQGTKEALQSLPEPITVRLVDSVTNAELLAIEVGSQ